MPRARASEPDSIRATQLIGSFDLPGAMCMSVRGQAGQKKRSCVAAGSVDWLHAHSKPPRIALHRCVHSLALAVQIWRAQTLVAKYGVEARCLDL